MAVGADHGDQIGAPVLPRQPIVARLDRQKHGLAHLIDGAFGQRIGQLGVGGKIAIARQACGVVGQLQPAQPIERRKRALGVLGGLPDLLLNGSAEGRSHRQCHHDREPSHHGGCGQPYPCTKHNQPLRLQWNYWSAYSRRGDTFSPTRASVKGKQPLQVSHVFTGKRP